MCGVKFREKYKFYTIVQQKVYDFVLLFLQGTEGTQQTSPNLLHLSREIVCYIIIINLVLKFLQFCHHLCETLSTTIHLEYTSEKHHNSLRRSLLVAFVDTVG